MSWRDAIAKTIAEGIRAYHGSPYDFNKFDLSKIGTGEGGNAYGRGLYFAGNEATAKYYRDALTQDKSRALVGDPSLTIPRWVANGIESGTPVDNYIKDFQGRIAEHHRLLADPETPQPWNVQSNIPGLENIVTALERVKAGEQLAPSGRMYEVNINADPNSFLDWHKPLSKQPQALQDWATAQPARITGNDMLSGQLSEPTGESIYRRLGYPEDASSQLLEAGVPGVKYLDAGSRMVRNPIPGGYYDTHPGTSNYVVFNPDIVDILKKYALPGAVGAGATMGELADQNQYSGPQP
jgi:hypothetical protein